MWSSAREAAETGGRCASLLNVRFISLSWRRRATLSGRWSAGCPRFKIPATAVADAMVGITTGVGGTANELADGSTRELGLDS